MKTLDISEERVLEVWDLCSAGYIQHGRKLNFPANTTPSKTYQWRYAKALANKFDEWNFDTATAQRFVDIAIRHAKQCKTLHKGLAALHQGNLLQICYDVLLAEEENNNQSLSSLGHIKRWWDSQLAGKQPLKTLLHRQTSGAYCNLVIWYQSSKLSPLYLALSKTCGIAMARLSEQDQSERALLPKATELYRLRTEFLTDLGTKKQAQTIFGNDWRELCL